MSVDRVRELLMEDAVHQQGREQEVLLDRFVLEIQAEIDCEWVGGDQIFDCTGTFAGELYPEFSRGGELCVTCAARKNLNELTSGVRV